MKLDALSEGFLSYVQLWQQKLQRAGEFVSTSLRFSICKMKINLEYQVLEEAECLGWGHPWGWHKERHGYCPTFP